MASASSAPARAETAATAIATVDKDKKPLEQPGDGLLLAEELENWSTLEGGERKRKKKKKKRSRVAAIGVAAEGPSTADGKTPSIQVPDFPANDRPFPLEDYIPCSPPTTAVNWESPRRAAAAKQQRDEEDVDASLPLTDDGVSAGSAASKALFTDAATSAVDLVQPIQLSEPAHDSIAIGAAMQEDEEVAAAYESATQPPSSQSSIPPPASGEMVDIDIIIESAATASRVLPPLDQREDAQTEEDSLDRYRRSMARPQPGAESSLKTGDVTPFQKTSWLLDRVSSDDFTLKSRTLAVSQTDDTEAIETIRRRNKTPLPVLREPELESTPPEPELSAKSSTPAKKSTSPRSPWSNALGDYEEPPSPGNGDLSPTGGGSELLIADGQTYFMYEQVCS